MKYRITSLFDHSAAIALLIIVILIMIKPEQKLNTDDLIEKAITSDGKKLEKGGRLIIHLWHWIPDVMGCTNPKDFIENTRTIRSSGLIRWCRKKSLISDWVAGLKPITTSYINDETIGVLYQKHSSGSTPIKKNDHWAIDIQNINRCRR